MRQLGLERFGPEGQGMWATKPTGRPWFFTFQAAQSSSAPESRSIVSLWVVNCQKLEMANTLEMYFEDQNALGVLVKHQVVVPAAPGLNPLPIEVSSPLHRNFCKG